MLKHIHLENVGPSARLDIDFSSRLNLVTGDNGLGKSFLLDVAWWSLTRKWPRDVNKGLTSGYPARPTDKKLESKIGFSLTTKTKKIVEYESTYSLRDEAWVGRSGRPWNPGLVIYAHADGGFSVWDPARNYWRQRGNVDVQERIPAYVFTEREVWDGLDVSVDGKSVTVCNGLIRDWAGWIKEKRSNAKRMAVVLRKLSPSENAEDELVPGPLQRVSIDDAREIPSIKMPYGRSVPIIHASAGIRRVTALSYMLLWAWNEHVNAVSQLGESRANQVVLIVDEVESHLHPKWQRSVLGSLMEMSTTMHRSAKIQLIVATHSPLVMASAEPIFDPSQDSWLDIDLVPSGDDFEVVAQKRSFVSQGDVSNWLTSEAFNLKSARSKKAEEAIRMAEKVLRKEKISKKAMAEADAALRDAALPDIDPFWVRWTAMMEKLGGEG